MSTVRLVADPYPPYQYEEDGTTKGMDFELIATAFAASGMEATIQLLPWEACLAAMAAQEADAIFQITRTPQREEQYTFLAPFRTARTLLFKQGSTPLELASLTDLVQLTKTHPIGTVKGFSYNALVDALVPEAKIETDSQEELFQELADGRFDIALADSGVAAFLLEKMGFDGIEPVEGIEIGRELHLAAQKDLPGVVEAFDAGLRELRRDGRYAQIVDRYTLSS